ncbi:MAG TPA: alpha/beta hydrolase-fold protein [Candidatus Limnocylindria bacterium]|nr:alpha/beta hydrolase-fold protein [Candidatus Limnocylindria bacterium]
MPGIPGREVLAYLPPSLAALGPAAAAVSGRRYPVLYFHDGQNVFDQVTSYSGEWHVDETLEMLAGEGLEAIAVAVPNAGDGRMDEYNPWPESDHLWHGRRVGGMGDAYLAFLTETVMALVEGSFPVSRAREATGVIGSSMGGLISLYALLACGDRFGLAGVMSPSLGWSDFRLLRLIEERGLPPARLHLDMGGLEWRGMTAQARRLRGLLLAQGFVEGRDLHYVEDPRARHDEGAWAARLPDALRFLLAETRSG